jgi:hypothetical protein
MSAASKAAGKAARKKARPRLPSMTAEQVSRLAGTDMAYTSVIEGPEDGGRDVTGWYLGLAVRNQPGYHQLKPGYGPYESHEAAEEHADELNAKLGHAGTSAIEVVLSSMAGFRAVGK